MLEGHPEAYYRVCADIFLPLQLYNTRQHDRTWPGVTMIIKQVGEVQYCLFAAQLTDP